MNGRKLELYKHFQAQHYDLLSIASQSFNKTILSLSTAIIGFTFAIIRLVDNKIEKLCQLKATWIFLAAAIFFILVSFITTQIHAQHRIKYMNSVIDEKYDVPYKHWTDWAMFYSALLSGVSFFFAIMYLISFSWSNILMLHN